MSQKRLLSTDFNGQYTNRHKKQAKAIKFHRGGHPLPRTHHSRSPPQSARGTRRTQTHRHRRTIPVYDNGNYKKMNGIY
ncbi:MAG: hypothetical protein GY928_29365 [Colwellia sp.]|nr:hypothetical protein [Colwellia sp.]